MAVRNIKLTIAYDGTEYHGWQFQPGFRTVQGVLTEALRSLLGERARICGASRTDAGVSALGQVGLIQIDSPIPTENLAKAITDRLPEDMAVIEAVDIPMGLDVIGDVKSKLYRYTIFTGPVRPILHIRHCWHVPSMLDVSAMDAAAKLLVGQKDFKSFASAADARENTVCTLFRLDVTSSAPQPEGIIEPQYTNPKPAVAETTNSELRTPHSQLRYTIYDIRYTSWLYVDVEGDRFLYNMVRNIVGTLVEIGLGRWPPEKMNEILAAKNRSAAGPLAPAGGLCLMWIKY
jgi:tRNA pseudouridine38-40 synthase